MLVMVMTHFVTKVRRWVISERQVFVVRRNGLTGQGDQDHCHDECRHQTDRSNQSAVCGRSLRGHVPCVGTSCVWFVGVWMREGIDTGRNHIRSGGETGRDGRQDKRVRNW